MFGLNLAYWITAFVFFGGSIGSVMFCMKFGLPMPVLVFAPCISALVFTTIFIKYAPIKCPSCGRAAAGRFLKGAYVYDCDKCGYRKKKTTE